VTQSQGRSKDTSKDRAKGDSCRKGALGCAESPAVLLAGDSEAQKSACGAQHGAAEQAEDAHQNDNLVRRVHDKHG